MTTMRTNQRTEAYQILLTSCLPNISLMSYLVTDTKLFDEKDLLFLNMQPRQNPDVTRTNIECSSTASRTAAAFFEVNLEIAKGL